MLLLLLLLSAHPAEAASFTPSSDQRARRYYDQSVKHCLAAIEERIASGSLDPSRPRLELLRDKLSLGPATESELRVRLESLGARDPGVRSALDAVKKGRVKLTFHEPSAADATCRPETGALLLTRSTPPELAFCLHPDTQMGTYARVLFHEALHVAQMSGKGRLEALALPWEGGTKPLRRALAYEADVRYRRIEADSLAHIDENFSKLSPEKQELAQALEELRAFYFIDVTAAALGLREKRPSSVPVETFQADLDAQLASPGGLARLPVFSAWLTKNRAVRMQPLSWRFDLYRKALRARYLAVARHDDFFRRYLDDAVGAAHVARALVFYCDEMQAWRKFFSS